MARRHLALVTPTPTHSLLRALRDAAVDAVYRWRFRNTRTFTCADCDVTRTVVENATGADLRHAHAVATEHARHGFYVDRTGQPVGLAVYGG